ncbi:hypothetical protein ABZS66_12410 [Dactylosporangium sp. NPDC005572]|uniref:hypothetical protein n=1 Tax=Dactylosporangium sp. NPDC005572 TaxID=3156889 RepID=UPI0033BF441E
MRNYLQSLHDEVADKGIYVGSVVVGGLILGSQGHQTLSDSGFVASEFPTVSPDTLAEHYWRMLKDREVLELFEPAV